MIRVSLVCFSTAETTLRLDNHGQGFLISSSMFVASVIDHPFDILVSYVRAFSINNKYEDNFSNINDIVNFKTVFPVESGKRVLIL